MSSAAEARRTAAAAAIVAASAGAVYLPILANGFVNYDDTFLLLDNPFVRGLSWTHLRWMFSSLYMTTYQPLGWLAYAAIYRVWGLNPFGYHLASLLVHSLNAGLLFVLTLRLIQKGRGPGALAAAAFGAQIWALHPIQVESVAWVSQLPDILAVTFFLSALLVYLRHAESAGGGPRGAWRLALCWLLFLCAALFRWKALSLPVALVILDFYPLRRLRGGPDEWLSPAQRRVWLEKLPFLALAAAFVLVNARAKTLDTLYRPVLWPEDSAGRVVFYLGKLLWPSRLAPSYYTFQAQPSHPWIGPALLFIAASSVALVRARRRWPAGLAAWTAYLAAILPTLFLSLGGAVVIAVHYAYLACLSVSPLAAAGWLGLRRLSRAGLAGSSLLLLALLALATIRLESNWKDSETLWTYALSVEPRSYLAHANLGVALIEENRPEEALRQFQEQLKLHPGDERAPLYIERLQRWRRELHGDPAALENDLGASLYLQGRLDEALGHFRRSLSLRPEQEPARRNLGLALLTAGEPAEAADQLRAALALKPGSADVRNDLGIALLRSGRVEEAVAEFRRALAEAPDDPVALANLKRAISVSRGGP